MIADRKIREWARNQISDASTLNLDLFAWENRTFDSSGMELYFKERYTVTSETPSSSGASVKWGILYYDVIVDKGSGTEDQDDNAKLLADIFKPASNKDVVIETGLRIDLDEATTESRSDFEENRTQVPVRLEFRAYESE